MCVNVFVRTMGVFMSCVCACCVLVCVCCMLCVELFFLVGINTVNWNANGSLLVSSGDDTAVRCCRCAGSPTTCF